MRTKERTAAWTRETWQPRRSAFCEVHVLLQAGRDCMVAHDMQPTLIGEISLLALLHDGLMLMC